MMKAITPCKTLNYKMVNLFKAKQPNHHKPKPKEKRTHK